MIDVALWIEPNFGEATASPNSHRYQAAVLLVASCHTDEFATQAASLRGEIFDHTACLGIEIVEDRAVCAVRQNGQTLLGIDSSFIRNFQFLYRTKRHPSVRMLRKSLEDFTQLRRSTTANQRIRFLWDSKHTVQP